MGYFAVLTGNTVTNIIVCDNLETAQQATGLTCIEYTHDNAFNISDELTPAKIKEIEKTKAKAEAEKKAIADAEEAARIKEIEAENERLRKQEADRLATEEASKPKPVTGIFVKVEKN
jgi:hypothetical protein